MKLKSVLILFFLAFISVNCSMKTGNGAALKKADGTAYYMDANKKSLKVVIGEKDEGSEKVVKIFYNNKDYTIYVKELLESKPIIFASDRIIIFSEEREIKFQDGEWRCSEGIIFIPGDTEVSFIESSGIFYNPETDVLSCSHAIMKSKKIDPGKK